MAYGYNTSLIDKNKNANGRTLGVRLGRLCIRRRIPVSLVSDVVGVTRQTVYNWFTGRSEPSDKYTLAIKTFIRKYKNIS